MTELDIIDDFRLDSYSIIKGDQLVDPNCVIKEEVSSTNDVVHRDDFIRASGDCLCDQCSKKYYDHPMERSVAYLDWDGHAFLNRLCDGTLVKL